MSKRRKTEKVGTIKIDPWKLSWGHREHDLGCGKHDSRPKRCRTRQTQLKKMLREFE